eukprot:CAMPEP_0197623270 /NCGR_PEP_ID=MMETSP1338-20131121/3318_1 /TAXON_ID=43686 ORGANISM="Pelagodinium beii, Strain RCC1491" /NCGR_SAMPLE_ID=MMETSP1338 /ASSEMBLY_ACC=CAM_ASM_000754 /LENGTH=314 /DNA_ID=CAMNT_0043193185 /DNA_START=74 /DNA_END=1018 /DNA_ORIENTATION=-
MASMCTCTWLFALPYIAAVGAYSLVRSEVTAADASLTTVNSQIPRQLITTGKESLQHVKAEFLANVVRTANLNPDLKLRYLSDQDCYEYLQNYYNSTKLPGLYKAERHGMYRGDICRNAVLLREGGYYADMDIYPLVPFDQFGPPEVTFMSVFSTRRTLLLNAFMAATPGHPVLNKSLEMIPEWYRTGGQWNLTGQLGMGATLYGLDNLRSMSCPAVSLTSFADAMSKACGNHAIQMLDEIQCDHAPHTCPDERRLPIVKDGIYDSTGRQVAWSRFDSCGTYSCGGTGRKETRAEVSSLLSEAQLKKAFFFRSQ